MKQLYLLLIILYPFLLYGQHKDSLPRHYLSQVDKEAKDYRRKVDQQSMKLLSRLQKLEGRMKRKLTKHYPAIADSIFSTNNHVNVFILILR